MNTQELENAVFHYMVNTNDATKLRAANITAMMTDHWLEVANDYRRMVLEIKEYLRDIHYATSFTDARTDEELRLEKLLDNCNFTVRGTSIQHKTDI